MSINANFTNINHVNVSNSLYGTVPCVIENTADAPMNVVDWSKNYLRIDAASATSGGITFDVDASKGKITVSGTATLPVEFVISNTFMTLDDWFNLDSGSDSTQIGIKATYSGNVSQEFIGGGILDKGKTLYKVSIVVMPGTYSGTTLTPSLVKNGSRIGYTPADGFNVTACGRNIWNGGNLTFTKNKILAFHLPKGTYTIVADIVSSATKCYLATWSDSSLTKNTGKTYVDVGTGKRAVLTLTEDANQIGFYADTSGSTAAGKTATWSNIMIALGDTDADYEAFKGKSSVFLDKNTSAPASGLRSYDGATTILCDYPGAADVRASAKNSTELKSVVVNGKEVWKAEKVVVDNSKVVESNYITLNNGLSVKKDWWNTETPWGREATISMVTFKNVDEFKKARIEISTSASCEGSGSCSTDINGKAYSEAVGSVPGNSGVKIYEIDIKNGTVLAMNSKTYSSYVACKSNAYIYKITLHN